MRKRLLTAILAATLVMTSFPTDLYGETTSNSVATERNTEEETSESETEDTGQTDTSTDTSTTITDSGGTTQEETVEETTDATTTAEETETEDTEEEEDELSPGEIRLRDDGMYEYMTEDGEILVLDPEDPEFLRYYGDLLGVGDGTDDSVYNSDGISIIAFGSSYASGISGNWYNYPTYVEGQTVHNGIDVSYHNGTINWTGLKNMGVEFVIIRAGYRGYGGGGLVTDTKFASYIQGAYAAGIKVGVYFFSQAISTTEAIEEADYCWSIISSYSSMISLPVYIDYEWAYYSDGTAGRLKAANLSNATRTAICNAFCARMVSVSGLKAGIYANKDMFYSSMNFSDISSSYYIWLANYTATTSFTSRLECWQYTSNYSGFSTAGYMGSTYCDLNFWYGTLGTTTTTISLDSTSKTLTMTDSTTPTTTLTATSSNSAAINWTSSNTSVATVSSSSTSSGSAVTITAVAPGTATITATVSGTSVKKTCTVKVYKTLSSNDVTVTTASKTYDGTAVKATSYVTASGNIGTATYSVVFIDEDGNKSSTATDAGTYDLYITGTGYYQGSITIEDVLTINQKEISDSTITMTSDASQDYVADLSGIIEYTDSVTGSVLTYGTDYTLSYDIDGTEADSNNHKYVTVTVTGIGNYTGTRTDTMDINMAVLSSDMIADLPSYTYKGEAYTLDDIVDDFEVAYAGATLTYGVDYTAEILINDDVTTQGDVGTYTVVFTAVSTSDFSGSATKTFQVVAKEFDDDITINSIADQTYQNAWITLSDSLLTDSALEASLVEGTDYTCTYKNNKNVGTAKVTITGTGNYTGTLTTTFQIVKANLSAATVLVEGVSSYETTYTGKTKTPAVTVQINGNTISTSNYTVSYSDNTEVGTATITLTGKGNCTGSTTATFTIAEKNLSDSTRMTYGKFLNYLYSLDGLTPSPTVSYYGMTLTQGTDYIVKYFTAATVEAEDFDLSTALESGLDSITAAGTYYGAIVAVDGSSYTGSYLYPSSFIVSAASLSATGTLTVENSSLEYTGSDVGSDIGISVYYKDTLLTAGTDYTVSYMLSGSSEELMEVVDSGRYTVTVTGTGNYTGTLSTTILVLEEGQSVLSSQNYTVTLTEGSSYTYTGSAITPTVEITDASGDVLIEGVNYSLTYEDNVDAGIANIVITGKNQLIGTMTIPFTITQLAIGSNTTTTSTFTSNDLTATLAATSLTYTGKVQKSRLTLTNGTSTLLLGKDYTLSYSGSSVNVGSYTVTATLKGNYTGSVTFSYAITQASLDSITATVESQTCTGSSVTLDFSNFTMLLNGSALSQSVMESEFTISGYSNNTAVSGVLDKASVTITSDGSGNFVAGEKTISFSITQKSLADSDVVYTLGGAEVSGSVSALTMEYTGLALTPTVTVTLENGTALTQDTDFTVTYSNNKNAGTATVKITGKGNYTGTKSIVFVIESQEIDLSSATVTLSATSFTYTGSYIKPTVTVKYGTKTLTKGTDYTVTYSNNKNATTTTSLATVTITGKGNYTGTVEKTFEITRLSKSNASSITINNIPYQVYTGSTIKPDVVVTVNGRTLTYGEDYVLTVVNSAKIRSSAGTGTAIAIVTGIGNYSGELIRTSFTVKLGTVAQYRPTLSTDGTDTDVVLSWAELDGTESYEVMYGSESRNLTTYESMLVSQDTDGNWVVTDGDGNTIDATVTLTDGVFTLSADSSLFDVGEINYFKIRGSVSATDGTTAYTNSSLVKAIRVEEE